jgi:hypothetical protein
MRYQRDSEKEELCPYRLSVRSTAFHAVEPGSIPGRDAKVMVGSTGVRRRLINSGDWLDGLEREGS